MKKALCIVRHYPEIEALHKELTERKAVFDKELDELKEIAKQKDKFFQANRKQVWEKVKNICIEKGLIESTDGVFEFEESGVLTWRDKEEDIGEAFLNFLKGK